jgi:hypothetical protein
MQKIPSVSSTHDVFNVMRQLMVGLEAALSRVGARAGSREDLGVESRISDERTNLMAFFVETMIDQMVGFPLTAP